MPKRLPSWLLATSRIGSLAVLLGGLLAQCAAPSHQVRATRQGRATAPLVPQMTRSTEATEAQLNLAHKQGYAQELALKWYLTHAVPAAHQQPAGEYLVAYALGAPEGWYDLSGEALSWHAPAAGATTHLRIFVRDAADGREIPGLAVQATLTPAGGAALPAQELPAGWYPLLSGYGTNLALPPGRYHLRLAISPMPYRRHDPYNGDRLTRPVVAEFDEVLVAAELARQAPLSDAATAATDLVQAQGDAYHEALTALYEDANSGASQLAGDYRVGYAADYALATWERDESGKFAYDIDTEESTQLNAHVEATVQETRTGRFVPGLRLTATLATRQGGALGTHELPFEWHPWVFHYGENWRVPRAGFYRLHLHGEAPAFRRYGREAGRVFAHGFDVNFDSARVLTGAK